MPKPRQQQTTKPRNWLAVHAHSRTGSGHHNDKKRYSRKKKHKGMSHD